MTACVNRKHTKKVAAVVTASLVGALSLGVAPVAAMATDEGIDMLVSTPEEAAEAGTIVKFESGKSGDTFAANGKAQGLVPVEVMPAGGSNELEVSSYVVYKVVDKGTANAAQETGRTIDGENFWYDKTFDGDGKLWNALPDEIGNYAVFAKVEIDGAEVSVKAGATFSITAADLDDAALYEVKSDATDLSDETFVFDNSTWKVDGAKLGLKIGDTPLSAADFDFQYFDSEDKDVTASFAANKATKAGDYSVVITGTSGIYEGDKTTIEFTIAPLDLAEASVVIPDVVKSPSGVNKADLSKVTVNGVVYDGTWVDKYTTAAFVDLPTSTGEAKLTIAADDEALKADGLEGSVINSITTPYAVVNASVAVSATYGTGSFAGTLNVDYSAEKVETFDESKVAVSYTDPKTGKQVDTEDYILRVTNNDTKEVGGTEMLTTPGEYTVEVVLDAAANGYEFCSATIPTMIVKVTKGTIADADFIFAYKGDVVTDLTSAGIEYTPDVNVMDDIDVTVKTANGDVPESDYEVVIEKQDGTKLVEVDSIVEAGTYKVSVVAEGYTYSDTENFIMVNVAKRDLSGKDVTVRVKNAFEYKEGGKTHRVLPYTGDVIVPEYEWTIDGETWYALPADDYTATYTQKSKKVEFKEVGTYTAELDADDAESANYTNVAKLYPEISSLKVFLDVPMDQWYSQSVYNALMLEYINGYGDGQFFGPENPIKRGDVAVVLYNMSGASRPGAVSEDVKVDYMTYTTDKFSDVDEGMYYNEAIGWAAKLGIVNGYEGKFRPEDTVTAEEFAAMLANYAKAQSVDVDAAEADLSAYGDADQISEWAEQSVEWAVANDVMGGYELLRPQEQVSRARVAAMAVNYQPQKAADVLIPRK